MYRRKEELYEVVDQPSNAELQLLHGGSLETPTNNEY